MDDNLLAYIKNRLVAGLTREAIESELSNIGWVQEKINHAFQQVSQQNTLLTSQTPILSQSIVPQSSVEYAGFWIRTAAAVIDATILGLATNPILDLLGLNISIQNAAKFGRFFYTGPSEYPGPEFFAFYMGLIFSAIVAGVAYTVLSSFFYFLPLTYFTGQTLGKKVVRIKVLSTDLNKASFGEVLTRETLGRLISSLVLELGFLWVAFDEKKQGWHDKIAGTVVVKNR